MGQQQIGWDVTAADTVRYPDRLRQWDRVRQNGTASDRVRQNGTASEKVSVGHVQGG